MTTYCGLTLNHDNAAVYRLSRSWCSQLISRWELRRVSKPNNRKVNLTSRARGCVLKQVIVVSRKRNTKENTLIPDMFVSSCGGQDDSLYQHHHARFAITCSLQPADEQLKDERMGCKQPPSMSSSPIYDLSFRGTIFHGVVKGVSVTIEDQTMSVTSEVLTG